MHALPRRHGEGGQIDDNAALGRTAAAGADAGHDRRLDLWAGTSRDEPGQAGAETFPRGFEGVTIETVVQLPVDLPLAEELAQEELVDMANLTSAQTGIIGTIFVS